MNKDPEQSQLIKPCPFCGETPYTIKLMSNIITLICKNRKCPVRPETGCGRDWKIIRDWNTRTEPEELDFNKIPFGNASEVYDDDE